jgi:hypothetical protein
LLLPGAAVATAAAACADVALWLLRCGQGDAGRHVQLLPECSVQLCHKPGIVASRSHAYRRDDDATIPGL